MLSECQERDLLSTMKALIEAHKSWTKAVGQDHFYVKRKKKARLDEDGPSLSSSSSAIDGSSSSSRPPVSGGWADKEETKFVERLLAEVESQSPQYVALLRCNEAVQSLFKLIKYSLRLEIERTGPSLPLVYPLSHEHEHDMLVV